MCSADCLHSATAHLPVDGLQKGTTASHAHHVEKHGAHHLLLHCVPYRQSATHSPWLLAFEHSPCHRRKETPLPQSIMRHITLCGTPYPWGAASHNRLRCQQFRQTGHHHL